MEQYLIDRKLKMAEMRDVCGNLLRECHNNLGSRSLGLAVGQMPFLLKKKGEVEPSRLGISWQEMEQNAKVIDKLKKKHHRKKKDVTIKKTNLGEDQLTFSPEEYAKLQLIDECENRGIKYR